MGYGRIRTKDKDKNWIGPSTSYSFSRRWIVRNSVQFYYRDGKRNYDEYKDRNCSFFNLSHLIPLYSITEENRDMYYEERIVQRARCSSTQRNSWLPNAFFISSVSAANSTEIDDSAKQAAVHKFISNESENIIAGTREARRVFYHRNCRELFFQAS